MESNLIAKILSGTATEDEKSEYYNTLQKSQAKEELHYEMKNLWVKVSKKKYDIDKKKELANLWRHIDKKKSQRTNIYRVFRYAAIVILALGVGILGTLFVRQNTTTANIISQIYKAEKGSVAKIEVDEGTTIWLNSATELRYISNPETGERKVYLSGEALFDVKHVENSPFVVYAGNIGIYDFGTTFNVKAYEGGQVIETTLIEGDVELRDEAGRSLLALNPGQIAIYEQSSTRLRLEEANVSAIAAWREGKFVFHNKSLESICKELENWYDVEFRFDNEEIREEIYTGKIKRSTTVHYVLKMLKITTNLNFKIIEKPGGPDLVIIH